jgi:hypothetical protein
MHLKPDPVPGRMGVTGKSRLRKTLPAQPVRIGASDTFPGEADRLVLRVKKRFIRVTDLRAGFPVKNMRVISELYPL